MTFTHSRTAMNLKIEIEEVEALIEWHRENENRCADRQEYRDAAISQDRASGLQQLLNEHRAGCARALQHKGTV